MSRCVLHDKLVNDVEHNDVLSLYVNNYRLSTMIYNEMPANQILKPNLYLNLSIP